MPEQRKIKRASKTNRRKHRRKYPTLRDLKYAVALKKSDPAKFKSSARAQKIIKQYEDVFEELRIALAPQIRRIETTLSLVDTLSPEQQEAIGDLELPLVVDMMLRGGEFKRKRGRQRGAVLGKTQILIQNVARLDLVGKSRKEMAAELFPDMEFARAKGRIQKVFDHHASKINSAKQTLTKSTS